MTMSAARPRPSPTSSPGAATPIAFVGRIETSAVGRARFDGYRDALLAHGQTLDPALVWDISEGYRADAGYRAASEALANGLRFRAVLAASDELALGCMAAAGRPRPRDAGRHRLRGLRRPGVGRLLAAFDDHRVARRRCGRPRGRRHLQNPRRTALRPSSRRVIPTKLVLRQSA